MSLLAVICWALLFRDADPALADETDPTTTELDGSGSGFLMEPAADEGPAAAPELSSFEPEGGWSVWQSSG